MKTQTVMAFVLVAIFVAVESRSPPEQPFPYGACYEKLNQCSVLINQNPYFRQVQSDIHGVLENFEEACQASQTVVDCLTPVLNICPDDMRRQFTAALDITEYLCGDEGKSLVNQFKESQCYDDPTKIYELPGLFEYCAAEVLSNLPGEPAAGARCQAVDGIVECAAQGSTEACGHAAGRLVEEVSSRLAHVFTHEQCSGQSNPGEFIKKRVMELKRHIFL